MSSSTGGRPGGRARVRGAVLNKLMESGAPVLKRRRITTNGNVHHHGGGGRGGSGGGPGGGGPRTRGMTIETSNSNNNNNNITTNNHNGDLGGGGTGSSGSSPSSTDLPSAQQLITNISSSSSSSGYIGSSERTLSSTSEGEVALLLGVSDTSGRANNNNHHHGGQVQVHQVHLNNNKFKLSEGDSRLGVRNPHPPTGDLGEEGHHPEGSMMMEEGDEDEEEEEEVEIEETPRGRRVAAAAGRRNRMGGRGGGGGSGSSGDNEDGPHPPGIPTSTSTAETGGGGKKGSQVNQRTSPMKTRGMHNNSSSSGSSSDSSESSDSEDSSGMDEPKYSSVKPECQELVSDFERQFGYLREWLYVKRVADVQYKLVGVRAGTADEYLKPLAQLQENMRQRIRVARSLREFKITNMNNVFESERLSASQQHAADKNSLIESIRSEVEDRIHRLEEDRHNDFIPELWLVDSGIKPKNKKTVDLFGEKKKKAVTVSGPFVVYMLNDVDIAEDWTTIKKAFSSTVPKRKFPVENLMMAY